MPNISYQIGDAAKNYSPKYSGIFTTTDCPLTAQLFVYNPTTNVWDDISVTPFTSTYVTVNYAFVAGFRTAYDSTSG